MEGQKLAVMPIKKLLLNMGIPIILSMMMQAAYNIVDSIFVANIPETGEQALNALTLAFPVQMFMVAIGIGTGVGMNALLSKTLGQGDKEKASFVAGNAFFLGIVIYLVFLIFGLFGVKAFVASQTSNPQIMDMAIRYLRICCTCSFGIICFSLMEKVLQATGRSNLSTIAQITGAVTNIVLDPILIYGLLGLPQMGVDGAAWATVLGQVASAGIALFFHVTQNKEVKNGLSYMKPSGKIIGEIYSIGLPAIIAQALMSIMTYGLNIILVGISENAVTAYGLYYKVQQFILFAAFGLRDAITPIVAFNYGSGSKERVNEGIKYGMIDTLGIMLIGLVVLEVLAVPFTGIFGLSGETQQICILAMRVISLSFLFAGANVAYQGIFQALGGGMESLIISVCRQFLFVLPVAWGFAQMAKVNHEMIWLVWLTFLIAEGLSTLIAAILMKRIRASKIDGIKNSNKLAID
ncbi:Multi antimicrobial extrusion protein (Na(+)/drug antiporter), MATE family of MDR efflux pump [Lachnospiraceae bacterium TWA4]|nr:Multi antimicrobial extrusion protein (Na(+)/drug antiporter), MATE family of MDR efflux pump [Lachnospiraceae bacterium TWA4]